MRKLIPLKFFSWVLLATMLTVSITCMHEGAHAMQEQVNAAGELAHPDISTSHHCPCFPPEQQGDYDDCDTCCNCACHTTLTIQPLLLSYDPFILGLNTYDPFKHIPEVYLPKFIPPQISA